MPVFETQVLSPGLTSREDSLQSSDVWWGGRRELVLVQPGIIIGSARDAGNGTTTVLRPGMALGLITASNKLKEWDPTAVDGTERLFGFLLHDHNTQRNGSDTDAYADVMVAGPVKNSKVIIEGGDADISTHAQKHVLQLQGQGRFIFDDIEDNIIAGAWRGPTAKTADYTVLESDNGTWFTNKGDLDAIEFTLPAVAEIGLRYRFTAVADFSLKLIAGTVDTLVVFDDAAADSVSYETAGDIVGGTFEVIGDGALWYVLPINFADGVLVQTITIAT